MSLLGIVSNSKERPKVSKYVPRRPLILLLGNYDWANVGYKLMEAINRHTAFNARCIIRNKTRLGYPYDIFEGESSPILIQQLIDHADFILYISSFYGTSPHKIVPNRKTPSAIWHGGSYFRNGYEKFITSIHRRYKVIFSHRDLEKICKGIVRLQAPHDTDKYQYVDKEWDGKISIGHSPSKRSMKGTDMFILASNLLKNKFGDRVDIKLLEGSWDYVMENKKNLHFLFDQTNASYEFKTRGGGVATHGYGVSLIEAAAHGSICMAGSKYRDTPIRTVRSARGIVNVISNLIDSPDEMEKLSRNTREWVVKDHGYQNIGPYFVKHIEKYIPKKNYFESIKSLVCGMIPKKRQAVEFGRVRLYDFMSNVPKDGFINVAYVRDIPAYQMKCAGVDYSVLDKRDKLKGAKTAAFITFTEPLAKQVKKWIFTNMQVDHYLFKAYTSKSLVKFKARKRNEIVFPDNSSCSYTNYEKILGILERVGKATKTKCVFVSRHFHNKIVSWQSRYKWVKIQSLKSYDFGSRYGILVDATRQYASASIPRKLMVYVATGMVPIVHSTRKQVIKYLVDEEINHVVYDSPENIVLGVKANQKGKDYIIEKRYIDMIEILKKIDEEYGD